MNDYAPESMGTFQAGDCTLEGFRACLPISEIFGTYLHREKTETYYTGSICKFSLARPFGGKFVLKNLPLGYYQFRFVLSWDPMKVSVKERDVMEGGELALRQLLIAHSIVFSLSNEREEVVCHESGPLCGWELRGDESGQGSAYKWGHYGKDGNDGRGRLDVRADEGWGLTFSPRAEGVYTLDLKVGNGINSTRRELDLPITAELTLFGDGPAGSGRQTSEPR